MRVQIVAQRNLDNVFEMAVMEALKMCRLDGIATNNVLIPNVKFRNLPNEQDILVFTKGRVYTIDAKQLKPGYYQGTSGGVWKYSEDRYEWKPCTFMTHPLDVAFKKGRAVESFVRERSGKGDAIPEVISLIVVPDQADVSELGWREDGTTETGARLLLTSLSKLADLLAKDYETTSQARPTVDDLAELFGIRKSVQGTSLPCYLDDHVEVQAFLGREPRPVIRHLYSGYHHDFRQAIRVEVLPKFSAEERTERMLRGFRSNIMALNLVQHEAKLRLFSHFDTPMSLVVVNELFTQTTLGDRLKQGVMTWNEARPIFHQIVGMLRAAHAAGIVHRFIDSSCILLKQGNPPAVRVQGFFGAVVGGLSTIGPGDDDATSSFFAPERHHPDYRQSPLLDAYSVGRCLCAALTGEAGTLPAAQVPAAVAAIIGQLVSKMPEDRASAWEVLPALLA